MLHYHVSRYYINVKYVITGKQDVLTLRFSQDSLRKCCIKLKTNLSFFTESILICHFRKSTYVIIKLKKRAEFHYGSHRPCQSQSNDNSWYSGHVYVMQPFVISYLCLFYYKMFAVKRVFSSLLNDCCFFCLTPNVGK